MLGMTLAASMARSWWTFVVRGAFAILFGLICLFFPPVAVLALATLFGFWLLLDGISGLAVAWQTRGHGGWWLPLLEGIAGLLAGFLAIVWPFITALVLVLFVGVWAIMTGLFEVWAAIRLREQIKGEFWLGLAGVISVLFGLYVIIFPGAGILSVLWLIAIFAIAFGVSLIGLGWRLRGINGEMRHHGQMAARGSNP
jgi:uncharacterized membrane protein HdeD (DUF308 family)